MRPILLIGTILSAATVATVLAAPGADDKPAAPHIDPVEAGNYARQVNHIISMVSTQYIRPVERPDIALAALHGLYETARVPVPGALADEVRKTKNEEEMVALLTLTRASLGDRDALKGHLALLGSLKGLSVVLDSYSGLVSNEEWGRTDDGDFGPGLGMQVRDNLGVGPLVVQAVVPGSPAQRAGIRPGDQITHIDGKEVTTISGVPAASLLRRTSAPPLEAPTQPFRVEMTMLRPTTRQGRKVVLEEQIYRAETVLGVIRQDDNNWDYWIDRKNKIAHLRISTLSHGTSSDLADAVVALQGQGMRGLILDLRWCPGGFLNEAVNIAQVFVGDAKVATVRTRDGREVEYGEPRKGKTPAFPLIVLVNGETSGGAELIAAAIQDTKRGLVAGQRTLGKASVQTPIDLPVPNMKFKLTTGTFFRPSGKNLNRFADSKPADDWGVRPNANLESRISPELSKQIREWWLLQTLRPGHVNDALPLDDPAIDTQRQDALRALTEEIRD